MCPHSIESMVCQRRTINKPREEINKSKRTISYFKVNNRISLLLLI